MAKFRKKPLLIDAEQWFPGKSVDGVTEHAKGVGTIRTLEGTMIVSPGSWVVTGVSGERYPVRDDIFRKTYQRVGAVKS